MEKTKTTGKELSKSEPVEATPASLIELAIRQNVDIDKLEKLMLLQERWAANEAKKAFFVSLSQFQANCPVISKNKKAGFASKSGGSVGYNYATLDQIVFEIQKPLMDSGLTYRWEFGESNDGITVTCIITHVGGHSEKTVTSAKSDTSGAKNDIQSRGSTLTYLQRYTLIGALGIATAQDDVDGRKKSDGSVLHDDIITGIKNCNSVDDLSMFWELNDDLHKSKLFIDAVKNRKAEIQKGGVNGK